jgi:Ca2+-binding RTX toxin-like protein
MRKLLRIFTVTVLVASFSVSAGPAWAPVPSLTVLDEWTGLGVSPTALAHHEGDVVVTGWSENTILRLNGLGDLQETFSGGPWLTELNRIDVGPGGTMFVVRQVLNILLWESDGSFGGAWTGESFPGGPFADGGVNDVAVNRSNGQAYVAQGRFDPGGNLPMRIWSVNPDGSYAGSWGTEGSGDGEFAEPLGIAVGPNGDVYVADTWNARIQVFGPDGTYKSQWTTSDPMWQPRSIAVVGGVGSERVYVAAVGSIDVFDAAGTLVAQWAAAEGTQTLQDVAADGFGNVWVVANDGLSDPGASIIRLFDPVLTSCHGMVPTIVGTIGDDTLDGTGGQDVIAGIEGNDVISGLGGADVLCGGDGDDDLRGGPGDDTLLGENGNDKLRGAAGDDELLGGAGSDRLLSWPGNDIADGGGGSDIVDYLAAAGPVNVDISSGDATYEPLDASGPFTTTLKAIEKVDGTRYDDILVGNWKRNVLRGKQGEDMISGGDGDDDLIGGTEVDEIHGGAGADLVKGQAHDDLMWGDEDDDKLVGGNGNDTLWGGAGDDLLIGGLRTHLGTFVNTMDGGDGTDTCRWEGDPITNCN